MQFLLAISDEPVVVGSKQLMQLKSEGKFGNNQKCISIDDGNTWLSYPEVVALLSRRKAAASPGSSASQNPDTNVSVSPQDMPDRDSSSPEIGQDLPAEVGAAEKHAAEDETAGSAGTARKRSSPLLKQCPQCNCCIAYGNFVCRKCGFVYVPVLYGCAAATVILWLILPWLLGWFSWLNPLWSVAGYLALLSGGLIALETIQVARKVPSVRVKSLLHVVLTACIVAAAFFL